MDPLGPGRGPGSRARSGRQAPHRFRPSACRRAKEVLSLSRTWFGVIAVLVAVPLSLGLSWLGRWVGSEVLHAKPGAASGLSIVGFALGIVIAGGIGRMLQAHWAHGPTGPQRGRGGR